MFFTKKELVKIPDLAYIGLDDDDDDNDDNDDCYSFFLLETVHI